MLCVENLIRDVILGEICWMKIHHGERNLYEICDDLKKNIKLAVSKEHENFDILGVSVTPLCIKEGNKEKFGIGSIQVTFNSNGTSSSMFNYRSDENVISKDEFTDDMVLKSDELLEILEKNFKKACTIDN